MNEYNLRIQQDIINHIAVEVSNTTGTLYYNQAMKDPYAKDFQKEIVK